jgi:hypothetical protein
VKLEIAEEFNSKVTSTSPSGTPVPFPSQTQPLHSKPKDFRPNFSLSDGHSSLSGEHKKQQKRRESRYAPPLNHWESSLDKEQKEQERRHREEAEALALRNWQDEMRKREREGYQRQGEGQNASLLKSDGSRSCITDNGTLHSSPSRFAANESSTTIRPMASQAGSLYSPEAADVRLGDSSFLPAVARPVSHGPSIKPPHFSASRSLPVAGQDSDVAMDEMKQEDPEDTEMSMVSACASLLYFISMAFCRSSCYRSLNSLGINHTLLHPRPFHHQLKTNPPIFPFLPLHCHRRLRLYGQSRIIWLRNRQTYQDMVHQPKQISSLIRRYECPYSSMMFSRLTSPRSSLTILYLR